MKAIRNLIVFILIYMLMMTACFILVMNKMSWFDVVQSPASIVGVIVAFGTTIAFSIEQSER